MDLRKVLLSSTALLLLASVGCIGSTASAKRVHRHARIHRVYKVHNHKAKARKNKNINHKRAKVNKRVRKHTTRKHITRSRHANSSMYSQGYRMGKQVAHDDLQYAIIHGQENGNGDDVYANKTPKARYSLWNASVKLAKGNRQYNRGFLRGYKLGSKGKHNYGDGEGYQSNNLIIGNPVNTLTRAYREDMQYRNKNARRGFRDAIISGGFSNPKANHLKNNGNTAFGDNGSIKLRYNKNFIKGLQDGWTFINGNIG